MRIDTFWSIMEFAVPLALALAYEARARKLAGEGRPGAGLAPGHASAPGWW